MSKPNLLKAEERPTPEYLAREATKANRELVEGRYVHLIQGVQNFDQFGRLLRYVFVDGILKSLG